MFNRKKKNQPKKEIYKYHAAWQVTFGDTVEDQIRCLFRMSLSDVRYILKNPDKVFEVYVHHNELSNYIEKLNKELENNLENNLESNLDKELENNLDKKKYIFYDILERPYYLIDEEMLINFMKFRQINKKEISVNELNREQYGTVKVDKEVLFLANELNREQYGAVQKDKESILQAININNKDYFFWKRIIEVRTFLLYIILCLMIITGIIFIIQFFH